MADPTLPKPETCPYCGSDVEYHASSILVYGQDYGPMWVCTAFPYCDTYVSTHNERTYRDGKHVPMGTLADVETRRWRKAAHAALDPLWQKTDLPRSHAYAVVADFLDVSSDEAHIGLLSTNDCKNLIWALMKEGPSLT